MDQNKDIQYLSYQLDEGHLGRRIDVAASEVCNVTRSHMQKLIKCSLVFFADALVINASAKIKEAGNVTIVLLPGVSTDITASDINLDIIFEDDDLMVINKPAGLVVHPGVGHYNDTLVNALLFHKQAELSSIGGTIRPGVVHRLDKDTSGLLLIAKNDKSHVSLSEQIASRRCKRVYTALVWGGPIGGTIKTLIAKSRIDHFKMAIVRQNGKIAITHYSPIEKVAKGKLSLVTCRLDTGRTHQIRLHMSYIGHSILGDQIYGNNKRKISSNFLDASMQSRLLAFSRQWLHASYISFDHPVTGKLMEFSCPLPLELQEILDSLKSYA